MLAPIIIFTYRRNIDELIASLQKNKLAIQSDLYIFSDGYKNEIDKKDVLEVRENLKEIDGFANISLIESPNNKGLANSVIEGVTYVFESYEKLIVLEDDLVVSSDFLDYMNEALNFYQESENIWSISGYTPNLECLKEYDKDVFLSVRASSWGWATWKERWESIDWDIKDYKKFKKDKNAIKEFNRGGNDMSKMLETQMLGKIDSWAIRWCYNQFKKQSYTIYPRKSKLINVGFDEKGTHNSTGADRWSTSLSNDKIIFENLEINDKLIKCFAQKYDLEFKTKVGYFLKQYGGYKFVKKIMNRIQ